MTLRAIQKVSLAAMIVLAAIAFATASSAQPRPAADAVQPNVAQSNVAQSKAADLAPPAPAQDGDAGPDSSRHVRIPVTVVDGAGHYSQALSAHDFALRVDGDEQPVEFLWRDAGTPAAVGILVNISKDMEAKTWRRPPKMGQAGTAADLLVGALSAYDNIFLAAFARRFHVLEAYTTDHPSIDERIALLRVTDELDDLGDGFYESIIKGVTALAHAPAVCERRALVVITNDADDTSHHGADDAIAKAQFAGAVIYEIVIVSPREDLASVQQRLGRIARETGGAAYLVNWTGDRDRLISAVTSIASEIDNQYMLGFAVSPWSPLALSIELEVVSHPGMNARAPLVVRFHPANG